MNNGEWGGCIIGNLILGVDDKFRASGEVDELLECKLLEDEDKFRASGEEGKLLESWIMESKDKFRVSGEENEIMRWLHTQTNIKT